MSNLIFLTAQPAVLLASMTSISVPSSLLLEAAGAAYLGYKYHWAFYGLTLSSLYLYSGIGRENPLRFIHADTYPGYNDWLKTVMGS